MPWFKVDDSFYDHPKVFDAPDCAVALWLRAGCWSARNLTDGFVPARMPARLCDDPDTAIRELLDRGVWRRTKGGYQFHDWTDYQPSAAKVRDIRAKRAEAGKRGGQAKAAKQTASNLPDASQGFGKQISAPSRPDRDGTSVVSHLQGRNARATDDDDDFAGRVVDAIYAATGENVTPGHALEVAADIIAAARRPVGDRRAYVLAAIAAEAGTGNPRARFLPPKPPPAHFAARPEWCGDPYCNQATRRREDPDTGFDAGPCPKCSGGLSGQEAS